MSDVRTSKASHPVRAGNAFFEKFGSEPRTASDCAWLNGYVAALDATGNETFERQPAIALLREVLENISTVRPLEHFPAVTALAYCREKAIEALNATSAFQEVIVGEYEADGKVNMASSPLPEGTKLYARLPLRHSEKALEPRTESILDRKVTVCASCLCASCWQGDFYCDNYKAASTVDKTVRELFQINAKCVREDSGYWFKDADTGKVDYDAKSAAKRAFNALSE